MCWWLLVGSLQRMWWMASSVGTRMAGGDGQYNKSFMDPSKVGHGPRIVISSVTWPCFPWRYIHLIWIRRCHGEGSSSSLQNQATINIPFRVRYGILSRFQVEGGVHVHIYGAYRLQRERYKKMKKQNGIHQFLVSLHPSRWQGIIVNLEACTEYEAWTQFSWTNAWTQ